MRALLAVFPIERYSVDVQLPLALGDYDMPEPDLAIVPRDPMDYLASHPTGAILVVEVASPSTRKRDREYKRPYYIDEVGVPEYWIVDGQERSITVVHPGKSPATTYDRLTWSPPGIEAKLEIDLDDVFGRAE